MSNSISQNNDIYLVEPTPAHYDAFTKAIKNNQDMQMFTQFRADMKQEEFNELCNLYKDKRENPADFSLEDLTNDDKRKNKPEYFYFVIKGNEIIGCAGIRPLPLDNIDKNNISPCPKWNTLYPTTGTRATSSIYICKEHQGKGYASKTMELLLDKAKENGINQIVADVDNNNEGSIKLHNKIALTFPTKTYTISGINENNEKITHTRFAMDTTNNKERAQQLTNAEHLQKLHETLNKKNALNYITKTNKDNLTNIAIMHNLQNTQG